ncbi:MAG: MFS transporter [Anaerolineae bacterium]|nr:MFS transporter [Anaerolineae bacterium]
MSTHQHHSPSASLSKVTKLAFGIGDLGPAIVAAINGFFLNAFLLEVAGIPPTYAAAIFLIVKIWDAINDPLIGILTDRTQTRWGRRRPWLLFGAVPFALAYFLHWLVPDVGVGGKFWYYLVVALLLDTAYTAVNVPYTAMTPELSDDYDERTSLNAYRFSFSILGGTLAAFVHTIIISSYQGEAIVRGYALSAGIWAMVIVISNIITFIFTKESHFQSPQAEGPGLLEGLRLTLQNRAFIFVTIIYLLSWLAIQFVQNNLFLYVKYWARGEDQFQWLLLLLQLGSFVFVLIWARLSERLGKQTVYYLGTAFWVMASILIYFIPAGGVRWLYFIAPIASIGVSVCYLIPWSMLPDVVDLDELETGQRREGIFYGFFVFLQKLGISTGIAISNLILGWAGYVKPEYAGAPVPPEQTDGVLLALRLFVSLAPMLILLASYVAVWFYPITRLKHQQIQAQLARGRAQDVL